MLPKGTTIPLSSHSNEAVNRFCWVGDSAVQLDSRFGFLFIERGGAVIGESSIGDILEMADCDDSQLRKCINIHNLMALWAIVYPCWNPKTHTVLLRLPHKGPKVFRMVDGDKIWDPSNPNIKYAMSLLLQNLANNGLSSVAMEIRCNDDCLSRLRIPLEYALDQATQDPLYTEPKTLVIRPEQTHSADTQAEATVDFNDGDQIAREWAETDMEKRSDNTSPLEIDQFDLCKGIDEDCFSCIELGDEPNLSVCNPAPDTDPQPETSTKHQDIDHVDKPIHSSIGDKNAVPETISEEDPPQLADLEADSILHGVYLEETSSCSRFLVEDENEESQADGDTAQGSSDDHKIIEKKHEPIINSQPEAVDNTDNQDDLITSDAISCNNIDLQEDQRETSALLEAADNQNDAEITVQSNDPDGTVVDGSGDSGASDGSNDLIEAQKEATTKIHMRKSYNGKERFQLPTASSSKSKANETDQNQANTATDPLPEVAPEGTASTRHGGTASTDEASTLEDDEDLDVNVEDPIEEVDFNAVISETPCILARYLDEDGKLSKEWKAFAHFLGRPAANPKEWPVVFPILPGWKQPVYTYQLFGAFLVVHSSINFSGAFLCDEPGMGKSVEALLVCYLHREIAQNKEHIKTNPGKHWPLKNQVDEPCKASQNLFFTCACRKNSITSRIRINVGFNLFVVPATIISNWIKEFDKWLYPKLHSKSHPGLPRVHKSGMELAVAHRSEWESSLHVGSLHKDLLSNIDNYRSNDWIVLTTFGSLKCHLFELLQPKDPVPPSKSAFEVAVCVIDEFHTHKCPTSVFAKNYLFGEAPEMRIPGNPLWCAMSGTPFENGPYDMASYLRRFGQQEANRKRNGRVPAEVEQYRKWVGVGKATQTAATSNLQATLSKVKVHILAEAKSQISKCRKELVDFQMQVQVIRRDGGSKDAFNRFLIEMPLLTKKTVILNLPEKLADVCNNALGIVREKALEETEKAVRKWMERGSKGRRPEFSNYRIPTLTYSLRPQAMFPAFTKLKRNKIFENGWTAGIVASNGWATDDSPLRQYIRQMQQNSPKIKYLIERLEKRLESYEEALHRHENSDESNEVPRKPKAVVLSISPFVCAMIWLILSDHFAERTKIACYGAHLNQADRRDLINAFQEESVTNQGVDIIVGSIGTLGIGLSLHRADYLVLMEPQWTATAVRQAIMRIHRVAQKFPCQVEILHSPNVRSENIIHVRSELRSFIGSIHKEALKSVEDDKNDDGIIRIDMGEDQDGNSDDPGCSDKSSGTHSSSNDSNENTNDEDSENKGED